ncbi:putative holin [Klebsiella phage vB_KshKPC-M]|nr:putative holin [Klebsiella phage vB_KshKPC-M]
MRIHQRGNQKQRWRCPRGICNRAIIIAAIGLFFMILFGSFGAWLRWRDSKALRALEAGDIKTAVKIRSI